MSRRASASLRTRWARPLFSRHSRGVTLTAAGSRLLPYAVRMGPLVGTMPGGRRAMTAGPRDRSPSDRWRPPRPLRLSPGMAAFAADFPAVDLVLNTGTTEEFDRGGCWRIAWRAPSSAARWTIPNWPSAWSFGRSWLRSPRLDRPICAPCTRDPDLKIVVLRAGCSYRQRLEGHPGPSRGGRSQAAGIRHPGHDPGLRRRRHRGHPAATRGGGGRRPRRPGGDPCAAAPGGAGRHGPSSGGADGYASSAPARLRRQRRRGPPPGASRPRGRRRYRSDRSPVSRKTVSRRSINALACHR